MGGVICIMPPKPCMSNLVAKFFKVSTLFFEVNSMSARQQIAILVPN